MFDPIETQIQKITGTTNNLYHDIYNADLFDNLYKQEVCWCKNLGGWYIWTGKEWQRDENDNIKKYGMVFYSILLKRLVSFQGDDEHKKLFARHVKNSGESANINSMLDLVKGKLGKSQHHFDLNDDLFNCDNGTREIIKMIFREHRAGDYITKMSNVFYDKDAKCPLWEKFIHEIFLGNKDIIEFMQRVIGYSLTGSTKEHCFFILYGEGRNGKSKFLETLAYMMGDYCLNCPTSTFIKRREIQNSNDLARLKGSRMVTAIENNDNVFLDEAIIKQITGGDKITARFLNKEFFEFKPTFKIFFATNHKPTISGTDKGIWRRIKMIPFNLVITDENDDKNLGEKLKLEVSGIFNWALKGYEEWSKCGLDTPAVITKLNKEYEESEDVIGQFIGDECIANENGIIKVKEFKEKLFNTLGFKISQRKIGDYMSKKGYKEKQNKYTVDNQQVRGYKGLRWLTEVEKVSSQGWE